jgi:hypothetical protein
MDGLPTVDPHLAAPEAAMAEKDWYHMCNKQTDGDLETDSEAEQELVSGIQ